MRTRSHRLRSYLEPLEDRIQPAGLGDFAIGDVNGSGVASLVTATGPGQLLTVQAIYGGTRSFNEAAVFTTINDEKPAYYPTGLVLASLNPFAGFSGGATVACGDFNGDGADDIAIGAGAGGGPRVMVFDLFHNAILFDDYVFESSFLGGVEVAAGDLDNDGVADLVVGAQSGGAPRIDVLSLANDWNPIHSFYAMDQGFTGGVSLAVGKLLNRGNDGVANLIVGAGVGGGPRVDVFDLTTGTAPLVSFFAGDSTDTGGVNVTAVTGAWIDGVIAVSSASLDPTGLVSLFSLSATNTIVTGDTVQLGNLGGPLVLAGGGFDYPDIPVLFAGPTGGLDVTVFGIEATNDFFTVDEFNETYAGTSITIDGVPTNPNALAVLPAFDPTQVTQTILAGQTYSVVSNFAPLTLIPAPLRDYTSPYTLTGADPSLIGDYSQSPRSNPAAWYKTTGQDAQYGPDAITFTVPLAVANLSPLEQAKRLVSAAMLLVDQTFYSHFHVPSFVPPLTQAWDVAQVAMRVLPGVDCSDFTSFIYNFALGIGLKTGVGAQATQTSATQSFDDGSSQMITIQSTAVDPGTTQAEVTATYNQLLKVLQPGDLLYIDGTGPGLNTSSSGDRTAADAKHVIMWLGVLGSSPDGVPLVIDSTGPEHIDSNGYHTPAGVQIRPFAPQGVNSWYIHDILSWSRIIPQAT